MENFRDAHFSFLYVVVRTYCRQFLTNMITKKGNKIDTCVL